MKKSELTLSARIQYIWDYYKVPLFLAALLIYIICYIGWRHVTHKDIILYVAAVNTPVTKDAEEYIGSFPASAYAALAADDGQADADYSAKRKSSNEVVSLVRDLYLAGDPDSEYHQYVYASRMKILASIDAEQLDIVLADLEAMEAFAAQGFLLPLSDMFTDIPQISDRLRNGTVILEDNHIDVMLSDAVPYEAVTREEELFIDLSGLATIPDISSDKPVYLGILANTPRRDTAIAFVRYLFTE